MTADHFKSKVGSTFLGSLIQRNLHILERPTCEAFANINGSIISKEMLLSLEDLMPQVSKLQLQVLK